MAYLHEGLSEGETKIVEQLFNSGAIQVIHSLVQEISVTREKINEDGGLLLPSLPCIGLVM